MRTLVACPRCHRQFDLSDQPVGARLACPCGGELVVPASAGRDAAVVRCSACGAPRLEGAAACSFCGSQFTLREQDLNTLCPHCLARVSDHGLYCHFCGTKIAPEAWSDSAASLDCPLCGPEAELRTQVLAGSTLRIEDCPRCAGTWVAEATFEALLAQGPARPAALGNALVPTPEGAPRNHATNPPAGDRPLYRPCPVCHRLMNRHNYARRSGVIIDVCAQHGIWFDRDELAAILSWTAAGGARRAEALAAMEQQDEERAQSFAKRFEPLPEEGRQRSDLPAFAQALGSLLETLGHLLQR